MYNEQLQSMMGETVHRGSLYLDRDEFNNLYELSQFANPEEYTTAEDQAENLTVQRDNDHGEEFEYMTAYQDCDKDYRTMNHEDYYQDSVTQDDMQDYQNDMEDYITTQDDQDGYRYDPEGHRTANQDPHLDYRTVDQYDHAATVNQDDIDDTYMDAYQDSHSPEDYMHRTASQNYSDYGAVDQYNTIYYSDDGVGYRIVDQGDGNMVYQQIDYQTAEYEYHDAVDDYSRRPKR